MKGVLKLNKSKILEFLKQSAYFLIFEVIFLTFTIPVVAFYGPYEKVKQVVVGSFMETGSHQYIAKLFLSDKKIEQILGSNDNDIKSKNIDISKFKLSNVVELSEIKNNKNFKGYMLSVHDPERVKVGYSMDFNISKMDMDILASRYNAVAAINAGGFSCYKYNVPAGYIISGGKIKYSESEDYNVKYDAVVINKQGKMVVGSYSINGLNPLNVSEAVCFGPTLIADGKGVVPEDGGIGTIGTGLAPRTAIGQKADGTILMLAVDGRHLTNMDFGASLKDIEEIMLQYGAVNAFNLDGGGSTSMFYNGEKLKLSNSNMGRAVSSIIYVK